MAEGTASFTRHVVRDVDASILVRQTATVPGVETTVLSYTAVQALILDSIEGTGTFAAEFRLYVNAGLKQTERMDVATPVARFMFIAGQRLEAGDVVDVKVVHYDGVTPRVFEATLKGHR